MYINEKHVSLNKMALQKDTTTCIYLISIVSDCIDSKYSTYMYMFYGDKTCTLYICLVIAECISAKALNGGFILVMLICTHCTQYQEQIEKS